MNRDEIQAKLDELQRQLQQLGNQLISQHPAGCKIVGKIEAYRELLEQNENANTEP